APLALLLVLGRRLDAEMLLHDAPDTARAVGFGAEPVVAHMQLAVVEAAGEAEADAAWLVAVAERAGLHPERAGPAPRVAAVALHAVAACAAAQGGALDGENGRGGL